MITKDPNPADVNGLTAELLEQVNQELAEMSIYDLLNFYFDRRCDEILLEKKADV